MEKYFITGTGTGIGKTFITGLLTGQLVAKRYKTIAAKPIITGFDAEQESDTSILLAAQGLPVNQKNIHTCSPWRFKAPLSPDLAAKKENRKVNFNEVVDFCANFGSKEDEFAFIEGAGGVMTPVTESKTFVDLLVRVKMPIILVTGSYLGTISHTLTAVASLAARRVTDIRIVINESENSHGSLDETKEAIERFCDAPVFVLPRFPRGTKPEDITNIIA